MRMAGLFAAVMWVGSTLAAAAPPSTATLLWFSEQAPGIDPYRSRMLVTGQFLRIDDGDDAGNFVLLDRKARQVYSVSHQDRTVLVVAAQPVTLEPPIPFKHDAQEDPESYPAVAGSPVRHYRLHTNGRPCLDVFAARGLLPDVVQALREYQQVLSGEHARTAARTPPEYNSVCDLADNVFVPARYLDYGLPVKQRDADGRERDLTDFRSDYALPAGHHLFDLPAGYRRYTTTDMLAH